MPFPPACGLCLLYPRLSPLRGAPSCSDAPLFLGERHVPPSGHRIPSRAPYCACKRPPPPLPAPLRCCANSHHVHRLVCSDWTVHADLLLGLAAATAALAGGLCFLVVLLGRHPAQPQGEPTALSPQHTAGSNDVCELWIGSTPRQGRPRGASTLVRQGQSAQALRQRVAQVPEGRLGLHAAAGLSRLSGRLLSREMCGQVRQAGPQARRTRLSPSHAPGRSSCVSRGEKRGQVDCPISAALHVERDRNNHIIYIHDARQTRRLPDWPLSRHLYYRPPPCSDPCAAGDQEWTIGPDSLAAPRLAPRGSAR